MQPAELGVAWHAETAAVMSIFIALLSICLRGLRKLIHLLYPSADPVAQQTLSPNTKQQLHDLRRYMSRRRSSSLDSLGSGGGSGGGDTPHSPTATRLHRQGTSGFSFGLGPSSKWTRATEAAKANVIASAAEKKRVMTRF